MAFVSIVDISSTFSNLRCTGQCNSLGCSIRENPPQKNNSLSIAIKDRHFNNLICYPPPLNNLTIIIQHQPVAAGQNPSLRQEYLKFCILPVLSEWL